jgi:hypothetical protein
MPPTSVNAINPAPCHPPKNLLKALKEMALRPIKTIVPPWSWKAAIFGSLLRSATFFTANLRSGPKQAIQAMIVEAFFAMIALGLIGAISQQLREAEPLWATIGVVWLGMPVIIVLAQFGLHRAVRTPHLTGGLVVSFCYTAISPAFSWYAMRRGAMLGGSDETTVVHDLQTLPGIAVDFAMAVPRAVLGTLRASR